MSHFVWNSRLIPVTSEPACTHLITQALASEPFVGWAARLDARFDLQSVHVQSVDMFGPRVGFMKIASMMADGLGGHRPCISFLRGGAVAILVILQRPTDGEEFVVLTTQPRGPSGSFQLAEIPAGMLDGEGKFAGVAARELQEETGLIINSADLIDLTHFAYQDNHPGMFPSPGGCDEFIRLYMYKAMAPPGLLEKLEGARGGLASEGEAIRVTCVPKDQVWRHAPDAKALAALLLYNEWTKEQGTSESKRRRLETELPSARL